jgi:hypothetical protein
MSLRNIVLSSVFGGALICGGVVLAQAPSPNIGDKYPSLQEAQRHIHEAYEKIDTAQQAHHGELGGHGEKAKDLLAEANRELKEAAEYLNHEK